MNEDSGLTNAAAGEATPGDKNQPDLTAITTAIKELAAQVGEIKQTQSELSEVTQTTRSKLQTKYDELLTEANGLRSFKETIEKSGLDKLPDGTQVAEVVSHKDTINAKLAADLETLQEKVTGMQLDKKRRDLEDLVFSNVAPEQRAAAEYVYSGILAKDGIDIEKEQDLGALANRVSEKIKTHFQAINGGKAPPAVRAKTHEIVDPNTVDWNSFNSWTELTPQQKAVVPQEHYVRMHKRTPASGGGPGGMNI